MKKRIISLILCILLLLPSILVNANSNQQFSDLGPEHWAYSAVMDMVNKGILTGFDDGTFRPNDPISREQFAKILVLSMNIPQKNPDTQTFADVSKEDWSYSYVEAVKMYLTGYKNGDKLYFRGTDPVVREDIAVSIVTAKGLDNQTPDLNVLEEYRDKDEISPSLRGYLAIAINNNIMEGNGSYFYPQNTLTRAEAAALIYKSGIASGKGNKVAIKDEGVGINYKVYNDGNITFNYPMNFDFNQYNYHMLPPAPGFTNQITESNGVRITVIYITYPEITEYMENFSLCNSTLDGILDQLNKGAFSLAEKQKFNNVLCVKDPISNIDLVFGRGIGKIVPRIQVDNFVNTSTGVENTLEENQKDEALRNSVINMIKNTFTVINPTPSIGEYNVADTTQIHVLSTTPATEATEVDLNTAVTIEYSQNFLNNTSVWIAARYYDVNNPDIEFTLYGKMQENKLIFPKIGSLEYGKTYVFEVKDLGNLINGKRVEDVSFTFTTKNQPKFISNFIIDLNFEVKDAVMDQARNTIFAIDEKQNKLYSINCHNKEIKEIAFKFHPKAIYLSNGKIYVALLDGEYEYCKENQHGQIVIVDVNSFEIINQFDIEIDPYDIVVANDECIYVTGGSDQFTSIKCYSADSKQEIDSSWIRMKSFIAYNPNLERIYAIDTDVSPIDIFAYNISNGKFTDPKYPGGYDSPYHGDYHMRGKIVISPEGKYIFNNAGTIFSSDLDKDKDMQYVGTLNKAYNAIAFDWDNNRFYTSIDNHSIYEYEYTSLKGINAYTTQGQAQYIFVKENKLIVICKIDVEGNSRYGIDILDIF